MNKKKIINALETFGRLPVYRITGLTGINPTRVKIILQGLIQEKKVIEEQETNSIYYRLL